MRVEKLTLSNWIAEEFKEAPFLFLISYQGLTVAEISDFRDKLAEAGATCRVLKNTFIRLGLLNSGYEIPTELSLSGDTAVVYGGEDPCTAAKVIKAFNKDHEDIAFKAGLVEGSFLSKSDCMALADLPSKEALQSQLLGVLEAVPTNLVRVLNAKVSSIAYVLQAYKNKLEQAS